MERRKAEVGGQTLGVVGMDMMSTPPATPTRGTRPGGFEPPPFGFGDRRSTTELRAYMLS